MGKQIKVSVFASSCLDEVKLAVIDMLVMLNRMSRGVEFVLVDSSDDVTGEDLAIALYWRDFGDLPQVKFETAYESLKAGGNPAKIYVFFRESPQELGEAMRAFKDSFASKYGHFYCHFEHVDSVRFQLAMQCLAYLQNRVEDLILLDDGGKVSLLGEHIADMENLPFAKLNAKRKSLKRQIESAENEVANLEEESVSEPDDEDLKDSLREARVKRHDLKEELKQYDGFLFSMALFFAKESAEEMDERVRKARELFEQGKVQAANQVLDFSELCKKVERDSAVLEAQREACEKDIQALLVKAMMVLLDDSMIMTARVDVASKAYETAIHVAKSCRWDEYKLAIVLSAYADLLQKQNRFQASIRLHEEALELYRRLALVTPKAYESYIAATLNDLANMHYRMQRFSDAEREYVEALKFYRCLASTNPEKYEADVAMMLTNIGVLYSTKRRFPEAERKLRESLKIHRRLAVANPETYESRLAGTLVSLANMYYEEDKFYETQCFLEAERAYVASLEIYCRLTAVKSGAYESYVAIILNNLGVLYRDSQRFPQAERVLGEALKIRRRLATINPEAHESDVATSLHNLASVYQSTQRFSEAERAYGEVLEIRRRLAARNPEIYEPDLACTLFDVIALLDGLPEREKDAVVVAKEALVVCLKCDARLPEPGRFVLEKSIISGWLQEHGERIEQQPVMERRRIMQTVKIFIASSEELTHERLEFSRIASELGPQLQERGLRIQPVKWEYLDSSMGPLHKQEEYNRELATCDIVFVLFWRHFGKYTEEEFRMAMNGLRSQHRPRRVVVMFKNNGDEMEPSLVAFQESLVPGDGLDVVEFASDGELCQKSRALILSCLEAL